MPGDAKTCHPNSHLKTGSNAKQSIATSSNLGTNERPNRKRRLQLSCGECREKKVTTLPLAFENRVCVLLMSYPNAVVVRPELALSEMYKDRKAGKVLVRDSNSAAVSVEQPIQPTASSAQQRRDSRSPSRSRSVEGIAFKGPDTGRERRRRRILARHR